MQCFKYFIARYFKREDNSKDKEREREKEIERVLNGHLRLITFMGIYFSLYLQGHTRQKCSKISICTFNS